MIRGDHSTLAESQPIRLLTTRFRVAFALVFAAISLALATTGIVRHSRTGWLFPPGLLSQGWMFVGVNVITYCWICWIFIWCIRNTAASERLFMFGLFVNFLLWPLRVLLPHWSDAMRYIGAFGLAVAVVTAFALLLDSSVRADS